MKRYLHARSTSPPSTLLGERHVWSAAAFAVKLTEMFDPSQAQQLLIYGGSFDPPHRAHVALPMQVLETTEADGVLYVPAGQPPHKQGQVMTPAEHRVAMLERALGDGLNHRAAIRMDEIERPGPSYMVDTLEQLKRELPRVTLRLLIGADMAAIFYAWRSPQRIMALAEPLVMLREPLDVEALLETLPADLPREERERWRGRIVPVTPMEVSSTAVREKLSEGDYDAPLIRQGLAPEVLNYIRDTGLYRQ